LFIVQVFEGAITWAEVKDCPLDEIDWLFNQAKEANDRRKAEAQESQSGARRVRARGGR